MPRHRRHVFYVVIALVHFGTTVSYGGATGQRRAVEPAPDSDTLPILDNAAEEWAHLVVDHSVRISPGLTPTAPFVDADFAAPLALSALVMKNAAQMSDDEFANSRELAALRAFIRARLDAGDVPNFDDTSALYEALLNRQATFPGGIARQPGCSSSPDLLNFVLELAQFSRAARQEERHSEGRRIPAEIRHPTQTVTVDFVNGIQTPLIKGLEWALHLGNELNLDVNHIHNEAGLPLADVIQALLNLNNLSNDAATLQVRDQVLEHARCDTPYLLICHSQGATICAAGIKRALAEAENDDERASISRRVGVIALGGFITDGSFPNLVKVRRIDADLDPIVYIARIFGSPNPLVLPKRVLQAAVRALNGRYHSLTESYVPSKDCRRRGDKLDDVKAAKNELLMSLVPRCGDGKVSQGHREGCDGDVGPGYGEECDGDIDSACPDQCIPPGQPNECRCPVCQTDLDCNPTATSQGVDPDPDCAWSRCVPNAQGADSRGCVEDSIEVAGTPCDDGIACTTDSQCGFDGRCYPLSGMDTLCANGPQDNGDADCVAVLCATIVHRPNGPWGCTFETVEGICSPCEASCPEGLVPGCDGFGHCLCFRDCR